jgi:hypothetical protein
MGIRQPVELTAQNYGDRVRQSQAHGDEDLMFDVQLRSVPQSSQFLNVWVPETP